MSDVYAARFVLSISVLFAISTMCAFADTTWPLPVPNGVEINDLSDFRGALYRLGDVALQIEDIEWMITPRFGLGIRRFRAYQTDGTHIEIVFALGQNRLVQTLEDFHGFRLEWVTTLGSSPAYDGASTSTGSSE